MKNEPQFTHIKMCTAGVQDVSRTPPFVPELVALVITVTLFKGDVTSGLYLTAV